MLGNSSVGIFVSPDSGEMDPEIARGVPEKRFSPRGNNDVLFGIGLEAEPRILGPGVDIGLSGSNFRVFISLMTRDPAPDWSARGPVSGNRVESLGLEIGINHNL